jgi:hypothetical protein
MKKIYECFTHQLSALAIIFIHLIAIYVSHYCFNIVLQVLSDDPIKYYTLWVFSIVVDLGLTFHALKGILRNYKEKDKRSIPVFKGIIIGISINNSPKTTLIQNN